MVAAPNHFLSKLFCLAIKRIFHLKNNQRATLGSSVTLSELAVVLVRLDHVAGRFPRNLESNFTHYLCEQRTENGDL